MAYQNPYPTYQNYDAMLRAMQGQGQGQPQQPYSPQYVPANYQYPGPGGITQAKAPNTNTGVKVADIAAGIAPTVIGQVAKNAAGNAGFGAVAGAAGAGGFGATAPALARGPVMGLGGSTALGIGTEIAGSLLKPKSDVATASPFADLTDQYKRREEGSGEGIAGGAVKWGGRGAQVGQYFGPIGLGVGAGVGALGGAIGGALSKNAKSAFTDFARKDAEEAIRQMYRTRGGREITEPELQQAIQGVGGDPGDKWVGEKGLYSILQSIDKNFAAERLADPYAEAAQAEARALGLAPPQRPAGAAPATVPAGAVPRGVPAGEMPGLALEGGLTPEERQRLARPTGGGTAYGASANTTLGPSAPPAGAPPATPSPAGTPPATTPPAADQSTWDTDSYAKPAYTAPSPTATPPPGFNQQKWNDPNHQTPKYVVGRILSQFPPKTENVPAAVAEIQKAYPGARQVGNGKVSIPGIGTMDILVGANVGGKRWHAGSAGPKKGEGKAGGVNTSGISAAADAARGYGEGGDIAGGSDIARIIARIGQLSGNKVSGIPSARDAVLRGFQG